MSGETCQCMRPLVAEDGEITATCQGCRNVSDSCDCKPAGPYVAIDGCLTWVKLTKDGPLPVMLATFNASIAEEVMRDDGAEQVLTWVVHVKARDGRTGEVTITPDQLGRPQQWATRAVGMSALVMPGLATADHLRVAVHSLSRDVERRTVFTHTGWRRVGGRNAYLTSTGALGAHGLDGSVTVDLGTLDGYALPDVPDVRDVRDAVLKSLALIDAAPDKITVPLLAAIYRAPLPLSPDCSVWVYGRSGTYKTALTAVAQQHYGPTMDAHGLPGNWTSTANALEAQAFTLDGALFTVDDYSPDTTKEDARRRAAAADRLIRGSANHAGRSRLRPDGTQRPAKPPRAQVLTSAEDIPPGVESMRARTLVTEISPGDVNLERLAELQKSAAAGVLSMALAGYVRWLAGRYDKDGGFPGALGAEVARLRDQARAEGHPRHALNIASLALGLHEFLSFAGEIRAVAVDKRDEMWLRCWKALAELGAEQERYAADAQPHQVYLRAIGALIASGAAYVASTSGRAPTDAERWGWRWDEAGDGSYRVRGDLIGWVDGEDLYLHPDVAYNAARKFTDSTPVPLAITKYAVHKMLHERGLLASIGGEGRLTVRKRAGGTSRTVLHFAAKTLEAD
jgi:hypothetical protein